MKFIVEKSRPLIWVLFSLAIFLTSNGCTIWGHVAGQSEDKLRSTVDQTLSIEQLDSAMIGKQIEVHSKSGTSIKGLYLGSEQFAYDSSLSLLLVKRGTDISRIDHSTISEIRVYAKKKNATRIFALIGAAVDLTILTIFIFTFNPFDGPVIF